MIYVVGLGPGDSIYRTGEATRAIECADILVGYRTYIELIRPEFPDKPVFATGMTGEVERCREAVRLSREGRTVCVICSGDAAVYGMASLILELADENDGVEIVPGVTAALSASARLGAPLGGDMVILSLSDLLTPVELIERRLRAAAMGDFCIALYNPSSRKRADYLERAADILMETQDGAIPCGWVRNIGRAGEQKGLTTLSGLKDIPADMFTTVIIGNSRTVRKGEWLITPRGYRK